MSLYASKSHSNDSRYRISPRRLVCFCSGAGEVYAKAKASEPVDAAALIAEALKRKFAHRHRHNSEHEDKEDFNLPVLEMKPQTETPLVRDGKHAS